MKPNILNRFCIKQLLAAAGFFAMSVGAHATNLYWDTNGTGAAGSGAATGTWGTSAFWTTDSTGANVGSPVLTAATTQADDLFFSAGTTGTAGTVTVSGTQLAHSITFDDAVAITLSGGTAINLGSATAGSGLFFTGNAANTISTGIILNSAATAVAISNSTASLQTIGAITGAATTGTQMITVGSSSTGGITLGGIIGNGAGGGNVALTINNTSTGVTTLSGANTYSGGTTLSAGALTLGSTTALGTGLLTITGGSLNSSVASLVNANNNAQTWNGNFIFTGTQSLNLGTGAVSLGTAAGTARTVTVTANTLTVGGNISNGTTATALTKAGAGTLTLFGTNAYTGVTTISAGILQFAKTASLYNGATGSWTPANIQVASGATLALNVGGSGEFAVGDVNTLLTSLSATSSNGLKAGANIGFDTTNATLGTFTQGNILANSTGTGGGAIGITKLGTGTLVLDKANTYTGTTTISAGQLNVTGSGKLGAITAGLAMSGGTLDLGTTSQTVGAISVTGTGASTIQNGSLTGGALTKTGTGTLSIGAGVSVASVLMSGSNAGTINVTTGGNLAVTGGITIGNITTGNTFTQNGGIVSAASLGISQGISNANGSYTLSGGTLNISGTTTVTSNSPNAGTLTISGGTANLNGIFLSGSTSSVTANLLIDGGRLNLGTGGLSTSTNATGTKRFGETTIGASANWATTTVNAISLTGTTNGTIFDTLDSVDGTTARTITINSVLGSTGKLVKTSIGTLVLNGGNTFSGGTTIKGGTIVAGVTDTSTTTSAFGGSSRAVTLGDSTGSADASLMIGGAFTVGNAITVQTGSTGNTLTLGGSNAASTTAIYGGAITLNKAVTLGALTSTATTDFQGLINDGAGSFAISTSGSGIVKLSKSTGNTYDGGTTVGTSNTLSVSNTSGSATGTGAVGLTAGAKLVGASGSSIAGQVNLNGSNDISSSAGTLTVGSLNITGTGNVLSTGTIAGNATQNSGSAFAVNGVLTGTDSIATGATLSGAGSVSGNVTVTGTGIIDFGSTGNIGGTLGVTGGNWNGQGSVTSAVTSSSGTFTIGSSGNLTANGGLNVTGGTIASGGSSSTITGSVNYTSASSSSFGGIIAGSSKTLTLNNSLAVLTLTNTSVSTYTGATNVDSGKLVVNGNISTSVLTTVNTGGTLGGSGTVGALTVLSGGTLAPGNSPGILNAGNTDLQLGSNLTMELDGTAVGVVGGYDQLNVTGSVSLAGALNLTMGFSPVVNTLFFIVANNGVDAITGTFSNALVDDQVYTFSGQQFKISYNGDSDTNAFNSVTGNDVVLMAVPEPSAAALLGSLGMLALLRRRRN